MTLTEHVTELRNRMMWLVAAFLVITVLSYFVAENIFDFLVSPLATILENSSSSHRLIYTNLVEAFVTKIKIALFAGIVLTFPVFAWHLYGFIAPGLFKRERKAMLPYLLFCPILFVFGAGLVYYYIMPMAWGFFLSFENDLSSTIPVVLEAKISEYISLTISLIIAFGVAFQLPLVLILLVHVGLLKVEKLVSFRRYAIVLIFLLAAILTPPDILSQVALAIPLVLLYEISIIICKRLKPKLKRKKNA
jgi:sec-independent protein translocase protein TatC